MRLPAHISLWKRIFFGQVFPIIAAFGVVFYAFSNLSSIHDKVALVEAADDIRLTLLDARRHEKNLSAEQRDEEQLAPFREQLEKLASALALLRAEIIAEINRENHRALVEGIEGYRSSAALVVAAIEEWRRLVEEIRLPGRLIESRARDKQTAFQLRRHEKNFIIYREPEAARGLALAAEALRRAEPQLAPLLQPYLVHFQALVATEQSAGGQIRAMQGHAGRVERHLAEFSRREREQIGEIIARARRLFLWTFVLLLATAGVSGLLITLNVVLPLRRVVESFRRLPAGDYTPVSLAHSIDTPSEIVVLVDAYNSTVREIHSARARLEEALRAIEEANRELIEKQDELVEAKKATAMRLLASEIAHELNNPLSSLTTLLSLCDEELAEDHPKKAHFELMLGELHRGRLVLTELADFAKKEPLRLKETSPRRLIEEAIALARRQSDGRGVGLAAALEALPEKALLDGVLVQQALLNVLANAFEFTPAGGRIEVRGRGEDGMLVIEIRDTGIGIRAEDLPRIFEPFFSTRKECGGTGLGLSIARKIVERHGGSIRAESPPSGGTLFRLRIPLRGGHG